jgi:hypothetical protein
VLALNPADSSIVYATTGVDASTKLIKSTDGGATWTDMGLTGVSITALVVDPNNPSTLYAGAGNIAFIGGSSYYYQGVPFGFGGGVFRSTDGGATWNATSLDGVSVKQLAITQSNPAVLYAGAFHSSDAFVTKINPTGEAIIYSTFLGGSGRDTGLAIAADASGNAYVTGKTHSGDFPLQDAIQTRRASGPSATGAFVARLDASGRALVYSTNLGGSTNAFGGGDAGRAIAVDPFGKVYVAGATESDDFPITNSIQKANGGEEDAFVVKIVLPPKITGASISGKNLVLAGENFDKSAVILLNGEEHRGRNDAANLSSVLVGKKLGKRIPPGERVILQVRTSEGMLSNVFSFVRPGG